MRVEKSFACALCVLAAAVCTASPGSAQGQSAEVNRVVQALDGHYNGARTLAADFLERYSEGGRQERVESGKVFFARPGRMRWEYESPETKLFVSDGKIVWFYVPQDHSATRQYVKQSDDWRTPLALLTGQVKLSRLCGRIDLADGRPLEGGAVVLECWPRGEKSPAAHGGGQDQPSPLDAGSDFTKVLLEVNPASGELNDVKIEQPGGVELEFRFGEWKMNALLASSLFEFEPPVGVAIVPGEASSDSAP